MSTPKGEGRHIPETEIKKYERIEWFQEMEMDEADRKHLVAEIQRIVADPERFIDRGGAGAVYKLSKGLCVKLLEDRERSAAAHLMDIGNPVAVEAAYLRRLADKSVEGVRVPFCYGFWQTDSAELPSAIIMEELDAVNLQHAINRTAELPPNFDLDKFIDALYAYLEYLHDEVGIVHGDLYPRNIMVDRNSGLPRYIDFGRTESLSGLTIKDRANKTREETAMCDDLTEKVESLTK